jgi:hypothetical protein
VTKPATSTVAKAAFQGMRARVSPPPNSGATRARRSRCWRRMLAPMWAGGQVVRHLQDRIARARIGRRIAIGRMVERAAQRRVAQIASWSDVVVEPLALRAFPPVERWGGPAGAHARCSSTDR